MSYKAFQPLHDSIREGTIAAKCNSFKLLIFLKGSAEAYYKLPMISQVKTRTISDPDEAGRRIDNMLISILKKVPRGLIYRLIRQGQVLSLIHI